MRTDADQESGKHDILPVAGAIQDHAGVPVMLPRETDADMRRDGSSTAQSVETPPSMSAEECTAHQDSAADQAPGRRSHTQACRGVAVGSGVQPASRRSI
ncbi:MAG: hypothetical protein C0481_03735 [Phenylobacterium sp.]|nr:hypothetical protein [Phenylobacterium sp.]